MQTRIVLNGRFLSRPASGVDRVAHQMAAQMTHIARQVGSGQLAIDLALPTATPREFPWEFSAVRTGRLDGLPFEQLELGRLAGDGWLYNPCNTGPIFRRRQLVTIHDAQIYAAPHAYSRAFVAWYRMMLPMLGRNAALMTTVSEFSRSELARFGVAPRERIAIVPNGADHLDLIEDDPATLETFGLRAGAYILAVGGLSPHKNHAMLASAALRAGATLAIAGEANRKVFAANGLDESPNIRRLGRVSDAQLKALYKNATALAFPSITEGFGLPPLEAMRCGCPVIASTGGPLRKTCGNAALFVDPHDLAGWTQALRRIEIDAALRAGLIERGYVQSALFTWRHAALDICSLIAAADGNLPLVERLTGMGHTRAAAS